MSRSYRHTPIKKFAYDGHERKKAKRIANRLVRRTFKRNPEDYSLGGNEYRKIPFGWYVVDTIYKMTREEAIADYRHYCQLEAYVSAYCNEKTAKRRAERFKEDYPTEEAYLRWWEKCYKRK